MKAKIVETNSHLTEEIEKEIILDVHTNFQRKSYFYKKYREKYGFSQKTMIELFKDYKLDKNLFDSCKVKHRKIITTSEKNKPLYDYMKTWDISKLYKTLKDHDIFFKEFTKAVHMKENTLSFFLNKISTDRIRNYTIQHKEIPKEIIDSAEEHDINYVIELLVQEMNLDREKMKKIINGEYIC